MREGPKNRLRLAGKSHIFKGQDGWSRLVRGQVRGKDSRQRVKGTRF